MPGGHHRTTAAQRFRYIGNVAENTSEAAQGCVRVLRYFASAQRQNGIGDIRVAVPGQI